MHPLDNWTAGTNKAVEIARKQYQALLKERHKNEVWDRPNADKVYYTCTNCVRSDGNHELYHRDEMLEIPDSKGNITRRLCKKHAKKYIPYLKRG